MPAKKRSKSDTVTLYSARGTQVTVKAELEKSLLSMGFSVQAPSPGSLDTPSETPPVEE